MKATLRVERHVRVSASILPFTQNYRQRVEKTPNLSSEVFFKGKACINYMNYEGPVLYRDELFRFVQGVDGATLLVLLFFDDVCHVVIFIIYFQIYAI